MFGLFSLYAHEDVRLHEPQQGRLATPFLGFGVRGADDFLDRLDGVAKLPAVLVGAQPAQRPLQPPLAIVAEVGLEPADELRRPTPSQSR